jgi:ribonuclease R
MIAKTKILNLLEKDGLAFSGLGNLFSFISNTYNLSMEEVKKDFNKLLAEGQIFEIKKGKYITIPSHGYVRGSFIGNSKGFGFVDVEGEENDIFIPANMTANAIDGDKVIIKILSKSDEGSDGQVAGIYKPVTYVAGVVTKINGVPFLEPDNNHIPFKFKLISGGLKYAENDRVVIKVIRNKAHLSGIVTEVLGKSDDIKACELAIIRDHQLYETFSGEVEAEVKKLPQKVLAKQKKGRVDLTNKVIFTIDGEDAKDLDDAISIERTDDGGYILGVHIADVGEYVKYDSALDGEAYNRGTSVYFPTSVLPMLPKELSNGICSLNEGVERLTLTCEMTVDKNGNVKSHKIYQSVIKSVARLNYTNVYKVLIGEEADEKTQKVAQELKIMHELSLKIQEKNAQNGCLDFEIPEVQFVFDDKGMAVGFERRERNDAHRLIEDFMVLANQTVAKEFCDKDIPFVYRVHETPSDEKLENLNDFLGYMGMSAVKPKGNLMPKDFSAVIAQAQESENPSLICTVVLRAMMKARYAEENLGHFGLAAQYYCHFTSPIRRLSDLATHRMISAVLISGERPEKYKSYARRASVAASESEIRALTAERRIDALYKALYMSERIGECYDAVITSVTRFGIFAELENTCEGLIPTPSLGSYFFYDEKKMTLTNGMTSYKIGDVVKIRVEEVSISASTVEFSIVR